jgi:hypothetical protein
MEPSKKGRKVWRRLIREDLTGSNPLLEGGRRSYEFVWYRWDSGYELVEWDGEEPYFKALLTDDPNNIYWYMPLIATPHLFLEFARLQERKDVDGAIRDWISDYGLLGLDTLELRPFREGVPSMMYFVGEHNTEGGPGETLAKFRAEVQAANRVLILYERALSKDVAKLEQVLEVGDASPDARRRREHFWSMAKRCGSTYADARVHEALEYVFENVQQVLEAFAYPCLTYNSSLEGPLVDHLWTPETMRSSLWPRNLLGAMYLQFLWFVDSAGELSHCKQCRRIISHARPRPGSGDRKPRRDKEFCDTHCRQNYHYHNRIKPARYGKSS